MFAPNAAETLATIVAASEALARSRASNPRPLVPATQTCPDCRAVRQIASPGPATCRACEATAPTTRTAA